MREVEKYSSLDCPKCGQRGSSREYADLTNPHPDAYISKKEYFVCTGIRGKFSFQDIGISRAGYYHLFACCDCRIIYAGVIKYYK